LGRLGPLRREDVTFIVDCSQAGAVITNTLLEVAALDLDAADDDGLGGQHGD